MYEYPRVSGMVCAGDRVVVVLSLESRRQISMLVNFEFTERLVIGSRRVYRGVYINKGDHSLKVEWEVTNGKKKSFVNRTGRECNSLPQELVEIEKVGSSGLL
jgi:hypothetical protein